MEYKIHSFPDQNAANGEQHVIQQKESGIAIWMNYKEYGNVVMSENKQELINRIKEIETTEKLNELDKLQGDFGMREDS